jgi:pilus assembly protein Flp/PilA
MFEQMFASLQLLRYSLLERAHDDEGATAVEYGLMVALIAVAIIVAVTLVGTNLSALFTDVAGELG